MYGVTGTRSTSGSRQSWCGWGSGRGQKGWNSGRIKRWRHGIQPGLANRLDPVPVWEGWMEEVGLSMREGGTRYHPSRFAHVAMDVPSRLPGRTPGHFDSQVIFNQYFTKWKKRLSSVRGSARFKM